MRSLQLRAEQLGRASSASPAPVPAGPGGCSAMQGSPRRRSAVSIFSNFFQGRRHSSSDPLLRILQRRRSSAVEVLSSSTHRVMVAVSSLSPEELDATFPDKKSKVFFTKAVGSSGYFFGIKSMYFCSVNYILYICIKYWVYFFFLYFIFCSLILYSRINICFSL